MLSRILKDGYEGGPPSLTMDLLRAAVAVEAEEAGRYFFERTDPDRRPLSEPLTSGGFPNLRPDFLASARDVFRAPNGAARPVFFETTRPWTDDADGAPDPRMGLHVVAGAAPPEMFPPALRRKIGAKLRTALQISQFVDPPEPGGPAMASDLFWLVPVGADGRSLLAPDDEDLPYVVGAAYTNPSPPELNELLKPALYAALFLTSCLNAAVGPTSLASIRPTDPREKADPANPPRKSLKVRPLLDRLDQSFAGLREALAAEAPEFEGLGEKYR